METIRTSTRLVMLTALLFALSVPAAAAEPVEVRNDRSDNTMYFQYDAVTGTMPSAYSSRVIRRRDRVDFFAYVAQRSDAPLGKRLRGRIVMRLNRDKPVHYEGRIVLVVEDGTGLTAVRRTRNVDFVLRPREGRRSRIFRWTFDLPSGDYTTFARFRSR